MNQKTLIDLGWVSPKIPLKVDVLKEFKLVRISTIHKDRFSVMGEDFEVSAHLAGRFYKDKKESFPVVGDWVLVKESDKGDKLIIHKLVPRRNYLSRKVSGRKAREQLIAANIDFAFIVQSLDNNYNLKRLERYIIMTHQKGITPVILFNKLDLCSDFSPIIEDVKKISEVYDVHPISCKTGQGMDEVRSYFTTGTTACFLGSSGVGKSSIINKLVKSNHQKIGDVRDSDSKGRHTTTRRQLLLLPTGGLVIDTPGVRELQLWEDSSQIESSFLDIQELSLKCRYKNCKHLKEPDCNVKQAVKDGNLSIERLNNFIKLNLETNQLKKFKSNS